MTQKDEQSLRLIERMVLRTIFDNSQNRSCRRFNQDLLQVFKMPDLIRTTKGKVNLLRCSVMWYVQRNFGRPDRHVYQKKIQLIEKPDYLPLALTLSLKSIKTQPKSIEHSKFQFYFSVK